jgi:hypothetical protein
LLISSENTPTGWRWRIAAFSAMFRANAVFPIDGRPAMMTRSPRWNPAVYLSMSV